MVFDKVCMLGIVVLVITMLTAASANVIFGPDDQLFNITYGSLTPNIDEIGGTISTSIIPENLKIRPNGTLHTFSVRIGSVRTESAVHIQLWRAVGEEGKYQLKRTKLLENMAVGLNVVHVQWYVTAGDYAGVSCNGFCPIFKDESQKDQTSKIALHSRVTRQFSNEMLVNFNDPLLTAALAIQVHVEANSPPPYTTPFPTPPLPTDAATDKIPQDLGKSTEAAKSTEVNTADTPRAQSDVISDIGIWWVVIGAALLIFLLCIALVLVALCGWRRDAKDNKRLKRRISRQNSTVSSERAYNDKGRPLSTVSSAVDTLARNSQGLQRISEIEVVNDQAAPHPYTVSTRSAEQRHFSRQYQPSDNRHAVVVFDNGVTNEDSPFSLPPPPPPISSPPTL